MVPMLYYLFMSNVMGVTWVIIKLVRTFFLALEFEGLPLFIVVMRDPVEFYPDSDIQKVRPPINILGSRKWL